MWLSMCCPTAACHADRFQRVSCVSYACCYCRRDAYAAIAPALAERREVNCLTVTWNVNEQRPGGSPFFQLVRDRSAGCQAVAVALQEVEVGGSSIALGAAKDVIARGLQARLQRGILLRLWTQDCDLGGSRTAVSQVFSVSRCFRLG